MKETPAPQEPQLPSHSEHTHRYKEARVTPNATSTQSPPEKLVQKKELNNKDTINCVNSNTKNNKKQSMSTEWHTNQQFENQVNEEAITHSTDEQNEFNSDSDLEEKEESLKNEWAEDGITKMEEMGMTPEEYTTYKNLARMDEYSIKSHGEETEQIDQEADNTEGWHDEEIEYHEVEDLEEDTEEQRTLELFAPRDQNNNYHNQAQVKEEKTPGAPSKSYSEHEAMETAPKEKALVEMKDQKNDSVNSQASQKGPLRQDQHMQKEIFDTSTKKSSSIETLSQKSSTTYKSIKVYKSQGNSDNVQRLYTWSH